MKRAIPRTSGQARLAGQTVGAIPPGAPFFSGLGAPHTVIGGYGFFARAERVPTWPAWESFGDPNGIDTLAEMKARIEAIRHRTGSAFGRHSPAGHDSRWTPLRHSRRPSAGIPASWSAAFITSAGSTTRTCVGPLPR